MGRYLNPSSRYYCLPLSNLLPQLMDVDRKAHSSDIITLDTNDISILLSDRDLKEPGIRVTLAEVEPRQTTCWSLDAPCPICGEGTLHRSSRKMWCTVCEAKWEFENEGNWLTEENVSDE